MPLVRGDNAEPLYVTSCIIIYGDVIALSIKLIIVCDDADHANWLQPTWHTRPFNPTRWREPQRDVT